MEDYDIPRPAHPYTPYREQEYQESDYVNTDRREQAEDSDSEPDYAEAAAKTNHGYVNVGRTIEKELNYIALREENERQMEREKEEREREERDKEREAARRDNDAIEKVRSSLKAKCECRPWKAMLLVFVSLTFLLSVAGTILGALAVSRLY